MKRAVAAVATLALALGALVLGPVAAANAAQGTSGQLLLNGAPLTPGAEVRAGDTLRLQIVYTPDAEGELLSIDLSGSGVGVSFSPSYPANQAIASIAPTASGVEVQFESPWPPIQDGIFELELVMDPIGGPTPGAIQWSDGIDGQSVPVTFLRPGDQRQNVGDSVAKSVNTNPTGTASTNLDGFVLTDGDGNYLGIDPSIVNRDVVYTLTVNTPAGTTRPAGFSVADVLAPGFGFAPNPPVLTVNERTWDTTGYIPADAARTDFSTTASTASTFTGAFANPIVGPSVITMRYTARVIDPAPLHTALQAAFDARNGAAGNYEIGTSGNTPTSTRNTVTFGGDATASATIRLRGTIAGPTPGDAFSKSGDLGTVVVETEADGTVIPAPIDVNYTLRANLSQWTGGSPNFTLNGDVIITDTLPAGGVAWNLPATIASTGLLANVADGGAPIAQLTNTGAVCEATVAGFRTASNPGDYCLDGKKLMINVGQNAGTNVQLSLPVQVTNVTGLFETTGAGDDYDRYRLRNTATFSHNTNYTTGNVDGFIVVPHDSSTGSNNPDAFSKTAPAGLTTAPNTPLQVPYTFTVNTSNAGVPAASVRILDHVDTRYFDIDASLANVTVSGTYNRVGSGATVSLVAADFDLVWDATAETLTVALTTTGQGKVNASTAGRNLEVLLTLTTRAFDGKETIDIPNRAEVYGTGPDPLYWAEFEVRGTSFGAESETRKHIWDQATNSGEWTSTLTEDMAAGDSYVYRLQYIAHPGFGGIAIPTLSDVLPAGLEFISFVDDQTGANPVAGPVAVNGNLLATFDPAAGPQGAVVLSQQGGTLFPVGATAEVMFTARVLDTGLAIVNDFGIGQAILIPGGPSIDIQKWVDEGTAPAYDASGAITNDGFAGDYDTAPGMSIPYGAPQTINFTISNDGPEPLRDIVVSDQLVSGAGALTGLVCAFPGGAAPGTTWAGPLEVGAQFDCVATLPALDPADTHENVATVTAVGVLSGLPVTDDDAWFGHVKSFAVGDYVWIDRDRDGLQGDDEPPLVGVQVELLDEHGVLIPGRVTFTDNRGRYLFDELPAGTYQVRFTLTDEQGARYRYTSLESVSGDTSVDSDRVDSNADAASANPLVGVSRQFVLDESNTQLVSDAAYEFFSVTATEGVDPTWDAGVTEIEYAVGDFVWIDSDDDGIQDPSEPVLSGVKVELLDGDGRVVGTTVTDGQGRYLFDRLPAGTYQMRFTLTDEQAAVYQFTKVGEGNSAADSDANPQPGADHVGLSAKFVLGPTNTSLTKIYDRDVWASEGIDPTWDAGVVLKPAALAALVNTGAPALGALALLAGAGVLGGGLLMLARRRKEEAVM